MRQSQEEEMLVGISHQRTASGAEQRQVMGDESLLYAQRSENRPGEWDVM